MITAVFRGGPWNRETRALSISGPIRVAKPPLAPWTSMFNPYVIDKQAIIPTTGTYAPCTMSFKNGTTPYVWMGWDD